MRITFVTRKFGNVERNLHCDVLHFTPIRVARLFLDCNGDVAIKAYSSKDNSHISGMIRKWSNLVHFEVSDSHQITCKNRLFVHNFNYKDLRHVEKRTQTFSFENEYKKTIKVELSLSQGIAILCTEFAVNTPAVHLLFFLPGTFTQIKARSQSQSDNTVLI